MIEYLNGLLEELTPTYAVLDLDGVGYVLQISSATYAGLEGKEGVKLYVHQVLREDSNTLYGFLQKEERELFRYLITVSGVGPNTARMMLSAFSVSELVGVIQTGNDGMIRKVKGIGAKTAQRVIVDLKGKVGTIGVEGIETLPGGSLAQGEALAALQALGFTKAASEKVLRDICAKEPSASTEQLIKMALKQL